ncbi:hypothetical protein JTE90_016212 [Oedothorax gibbosus]|uniref:Protein kinase domain-containing protein n=1 Tax=Oedothorax gibbosus TaxID=931172 RepID=A0AAV6UMM2_9ARAC|nr:hypothetical protein JTE90_016212 [Oedothorax gibbosus]
MSSSSVESAIEYLTTKEGFNCSEVIGKGSYGSVFKISKRDNKKLAAKVVEDSVVNLLEIQEWPRLHHDHVLQLVRTFLGLEGVVIFVTDLMETNLFQRLRNKDFRNDRQSPERCRMYARQVLSGLLVIHMYLGKGFQDSTVKPKNSGTIEACLKYMSYFKDQSFLEKFFNETYPKSVVSVERIKELMAFAQLFLQMSPEQRTKAEEALECRFLNAPFYRTVEPTRLATSLVTLMMHNPDLASRDVNEEGACGEDSTTGAKKKKKHWFRIGRIKVYKPSKFLFRSDKSKTDEKPGKKKKRTKFFI